IRKRLVLMNPGDNWERSQLTQRGSVAVESDYVIQRGIYSEPVLEFHSVFLTQYPERRCDPPQKRLLFCRLFLRVVLRRPASVREPFPKMPLPLPMGVR